MNKELKNKIFNLVANIVIFTIIFICLIHKNINSIKCTDSITTVLVNLALLIATLFIAFLSQNKIDEDKVTVSKMMSTKGREEVFKKTFETDKSKTLKIIDKFSCLFNFLIYLNIGIIASEYDIKFWFIVSLIAAILSSVFLLNIINDKYIKNKQKYIKVVNKFTDIFIKIAYSFFIATITVIS